MTKTVTTTTTTTTKDDSSSSIGIILLIIAIVFSSAFWVFILYSDYTLEEGSHTIAKKKYATNNITTLVVRFESGAVPVDIKFVEGQEDLIMDAQWRHLFSSYNQEENTTPKVEVVETLLDNETLQITILADMDKDAFYTEFGMNAWDFEIIINPNYVINFTAIGEAGSIDVEAKNVKFSQFIVEQTTGSTDIILGESTINNSFQITGTTSSTAVHIVKSTIIPEALITRETGSVDMVIKESYLGGISITEDTGSIEMVIQSSTINQTLTLATKRGSINTMIRKSLLETDITISAESGSIDMGMEDIELSATNTKYNITASTESGSIEIDMYQGKVLGADLSIVATATSGSINIEIDALASELLRITATAETESGSEEIGKEEI